MSNPGVVIVGAGLAGLTCAIELERARVSCTIIDCFFRPFLGRVFLDTELRTPGGQLEIWFGAQISCWEHLRTFVLERALPDQRPPRPSPRSPRLGSGVSACGGHRRNGSINSAMASGRGAARALVEDLRGSGS